MEVETSEASGLLALVATFVVIAIGLWRPGVGMVRLWRWSSSKPGGYLVEIEEPEEPREGSSSADSVVRFRRLPVQMPGKVRGVPVQIAAEVPQSSGANSL